MFMVLDFEICKNMRMATQHLVTYRLVNTVKIKPAPLFRHLCMENHLEQEITQFVLQVIGIIPGDGIGNLVSLFNGIGCNGGEILFDIPRAARFRIT